jgi:sterol-4alpha-carboxylate 3-dehydrogenase (decarboxylating)
MMLPASTHHLRSVLVIGDCGFVGFHITRHILLEPICSSVSVISRKPTRNRLPNVSYHAGDISDLATLRDLIRQISPTVIIHSACPSPTAASAKDYENVTVQGTRNLLNVASEVASVKAFIFTSSSTMAAGGEHVDVNEDAPLADTCSGSHPYAKTKAQADRMVLDFNKVAKDRGSNMRTACIRLPIVYGERDSLSVPGILAILEKGQTNFQLGDGTNLWDFASADNAAAAHVLLVKALVARDPRAAKVEGEAFNISDGQRHRFWEYPQVVWRAAGHEVKPHQIWVMPTRWALVMADMLEWLFWLFTMGTKRPAQMSRQQVEYSCLEHTYSIQKAMERLGYVPVLTPGFDEGIRRAVAWSLEEDGLGRQLKKLTKE